MPAAGGVHALLARRLGRCSHSISLLSAPLRSCCPMPRPLTVPISLLLLNRSIVVGVFFPRATVALFAAAGRKQNLPVNSNIKKTLKTGKVEEY